MMATQGKATPLGETRGRSSRIHYFGQYSLVSYQHQLRGERVNLGLLVWHPSLGSAVRFAKSLQRVRCIDEDADIDRVRKEIERIEETVTEWSEKDRSPLASLATEFRYGLTVSEPLNARICTPLSTLERLYSALISPEPFVRVSTAKQFARAFVGRLKAVLEERRVKDIQTDFVVQDTFQPINVAVWYKQRHNSFLWRAFSFATYKAEEQILAAKAIHAENLDLKALPKYSHSHLALAVQLPKPSARAAWPKAVQWLERRSERVEVFEDKQSLEEKVPGENVKPT